MGCAFGEQKEEQNTEKVAPGIGGGPGSPYPGSQAGWSAVFCLGRGLMAWKTQEWPRDQKSSRGQCRDSVRSRDTRGRPGGHRGRRVSEFRVLEVGELW